METGTIKYTVEFARIFFSDMLYAGPILGFLILLICLIGYVIGRIEGWSKLDAMYHAFINATTVGYGDLRPSKKSSTCAARTRARLEPPGSLDESWIRLRLRAARDALGHAHRR